MVLSGSDLLHVSFEYIFQIPSVFRLNNFRNIVPLRRIKHDRSRLVIYKQFRPGIILLNPLEPFTPESQEHTAFYLHCRRISYLFQVREAVFSHKVALFKHPFKSRVSLPSVAFPVPRVFCNLIPRIAV